MTDQPLIVPDMPRIRRLVEELLDRFPDPDDGHLMPGLLVQAWNPSIRTLTSVEPRQDGSGHAGKPGSRPPMRLDLIAHVQSCEVMAQEEADDLGSFHNSGERQTALRRLPALLEPTLDVDCAACAKCAQQADERCSCRHRMVTQRVGWCHSQLATALGWQEQRIDWPYATCPECERRGGLSVRKAQERVWCRLDGCQFERTGTLAILAVAS